MMPPGITAPKTNCRSPEAVAKGRRRRATERAAAQGSPRDRLRGPPLSHSALNWNTPGSLPSQNEERQPNYRLAPSAAYQHSA